MEAHARFEPQARRWPRRPPGAGALRRHVLKRTPLRVHASGAPVQLSEQDLVHLSAAAAESQQSEGLSAPHPNHGAVLVTADGIPLGSAFQRAQGTASAEELVLQLHTAGARGSTLYLNVECGDCHGDATALEWVLGTGVRRVVIGHRHPLAHARGVAVDVLRSRGVQVDLLEDDEGAVRPGSDAQQALLACLKANEPLLHRAVLQQPMSTLKYAMTLDGKIATHTGHSAWVSTPESRARVFAQRAATDCIIVGGNTVRRDNPRLLTRRERGHRPVRVVMSRTLDLPTEANLWNVTMAPTIVMTQRGARTDMQARLRDQGVEVVEFDFLTPASVAEYCSRRGFLKIFWECGGTLSAPAIASGTVHRVMAFVAPKIIGGQNGYSPVGNLGNVEMTQALHLLEPEYEIVSNDMLVSGWLASSGGPLALHQQLRSKKHAAPSTHMNLLHTALEAQRTARSAGGAAPDAAAADAGRRPPAPPQAPLALGESIGDTSLVARTGALENGATAAPAAAEGPSLNGVGGPTRSPQPSAAFPSGVVGEQRPATHTPGGRVEFFKAWAEWGALSNFTSHPIDMPRGPMAWMAGPPAGAPAATASADAAPRCRWQSVEHYYQAQKFTHAPGALPEAAERRCADIVDAVLEAQSPEEAAQVGRECERLESELVRPDWAEAKVAVMAAALEAKFLSHAGPRAMLLATAGLNGGAATDLVEASPRDYFWGEGAAGTGSNMLGVLLGRLRHKLMAQADAKGVLQPAEV